MMKEIKKILKVALSPAQRIRKATKEEKLAFQLEINEMLGDENINYLDKKYPHICSTPRENANVNNNRKIPELMEEGMLDKELIEKGYGGRTKIEARRVTFDLLKKKIKHRIVGK